VARLLLAFVLPGAALSVNVIIGLPAAGFLSSSR
jgi:hypothetical protein